MNSSLSVLPKLGLFAAGLFVAGTSVAMAASTLPSIPGVTVTSGLPMERPAIRNVWPAVNGFYDRELDFGAIPIQANDVVSDNAFYAAYDHLQNQLRYLPNVVLNLATAGANLHIIGKDQQTSDLPEYHDLKGKPLPEYNGLTVDQRTRGLGGLSVSCGEENLLKLDNDRYKGSDICYHEFAHCIENFGIPPSVRALFDAQYKASLAKGLWAGSYAASNSDEYFAELTMWYFGTHGDKKMTGPPPGDGAAGLKAYDPDAFSLFDRFYTGKIPINLIGNPSATHGLSFNQGETQYTLPDFTLRLVTSSQTVAALEPTGGDGFDFSPADQLYARSPNGYYHLGDLTMRIRAVSNAQWRDISTAAKRQPVFALPVSGNQIASADLASTLPADIPLKVVRTWSLVQNHLALTFEISNTSSSPVEIGALGIPMSFNNILIDRSLEQANRICSFSDPYIGMDAGYLQVTRLTGHGPALVVAPVGSTPFEAYRLLKEPIWPSQVFEGTFEWMVHSQAYADNEWKGVDEWNRPTMQTLAPGQSVVCGVEFLVSPNIRSISTTLAVNKRPVTVGIPGYVLPKGEYGKLFINYPSKVKSIAIDPAGAIEISTIRSPHEGWQAFSLAAKNWGRARVTLVYADGTKQSISYYLTKSQSQVADDLGHFLFTKSWFVDPTDPFHRSPSPITYDHEAGHQVVQDGRAWIAGLGDEGGSGPFVAAAMKEYGLPNPQEVTQYEQFIDQVLWGHIQYSDGPNKYGVRKSIFYYDPAALPSFAYDQSIDWRSWTSWNKQASEDYGRGYDYPHVVIAYWAMYRIARNHPGMVTNHPWQWYLNQAYQTTHFLFSRDNSGNRRVGWVELGLMEGDIFFSLLQDLKHEGWTSDADDVEALMAERAKQWSTEEYPFGSEMAWDSTGQEEVYTWSKYFGYRDKADVSLNSILGYMPTLPHWGYNGDARRYWDFLYDGKIQRIERQIHHYGSGLNAIPMLSEYRDHPDDYYLLNVGYGGTLGPLTNIAQDGFGSAAFHTFPDTLKWDALSGDYGMNFFGHAYNTATYVIDHPVFGWQSYGGDTVVNGTSVTVKPLDTFRMRVYIGPLGLWLTLDSGRFTHVVIDTKTHVVRLALDPSDRWTPTALLRIEQPAVVAGVGVYYPQITYATSRGGFVVPLSAKLTWVTLMVRKRH